eukprot:4000817-Alexandrium_andersonii.AAC.1
MSRRTCVSLSLPKSPNQGCAPSFGAASTAPGRRRRAGRRCVPRPWRASSLPEEKPVRAVSAMRSLTSVAWCTTTTSHSPALTRTWT